MMKKAVSILIIFIFKIGYSQNDESIVFPVYFEPTNNLNLVGNPYPSAIDLDKLFEVNAGLIDPVAYVWGRAIDDTPISTNPGPYQISYSQANYLVYNPTMNINFNPNNNAPFNDSGVLASCQSFFVQTTNTSGNLVFNNSMRTTMPNNTFAKIATTDTKDKLWLDLKTDKLFSQIGIAFLDTASDSYNSKEDVKELKGRALNFYTKTTSENLIIDAQSTFNINKIIPLGITSLKNDKNQEYTISINKTAGTFNTQTVYLEDRLLKKIINLTQKKYVFKLYNTISNDRFRLLFKDNSIANLGCFIDFDNGGADVLVVDNGGILKHWGSENGGNYPLPTNIDNSTDWQKVSSGLSHRLAIKNNGTLWAWGSNQYGCFGDGTTISNSNPTMIGNDTNWQFISAGSSHSIALKTNGTLWGWGLNAYGQLGDATTVNKYIPAQIGTETDWVKISANGLSTLAIKSNGTLWAWGRNNYGQLGDGTTVNKSVPIQIGTDTDWIEISCNSNGKHALALKSNGTLWSWGYNNGGQLGNGTFGVISGIPNSNEYFTTPLQVGIDSDWIGIATGYDSSYAIKSNGKIYSWGGNSSGQLGLNNTTPSNEPTQIGFDTDWIDVHSDGTFANAQKANGDLYSWGYNYGGQLGNGNYNSQYSPILIAGNCNLNVVSFNTNNFTIYPNPAKTMLNIETNDILIQKIVITDILGKKILEQNNNTTTINIETLQQGLYIVQVYGGDGVYNGKFVKE